MDIISMAGHQFVRSRVKISNVENVKLTWITPLPGNHACAVGPIKADLGHDEFPLHRLRSCTFIGFIRVVPKSRCLETMHFTIAIGTEADLGNDDFCYIVLRSCTFMDLSESKPRFHLFIF
jgi:hypothetical protein